MYNTYILISWGYKYAIVWTAPELLCPVRFSATVWQSCITIFDGFKWCDRKEGMRQNLCLDNALIIKIQNNDWGLISW